MSSKKGSEVNDEWEQIDGNLQTKTNNSGGLQGGISNGMPIYFEVALKPTATIGKQQNTINTLGEETILNATGRHDPCVVPRAAPIIQALTHWVLLDLFLLNKNATL
jgi:chorismate synthase